MNTLPTEEQWELISLIDRTKESTDKLIKLTKEMDRTLSALSYKIQSEIDPAIRDGFYELIDKDQWQKSLNRASEMTLALFGNLYEILSSSPLNQDVSRGTIGENYGDFSLDNDVDVRINNGKIIVKTPNLFNRNQRLYRQKQGVFAKDYGLFFSKEVRRKMESLGRNLPQYAFKNMSIFSCYSDKTKRIPDADNLDAKAIVDAILDFLPNADNGKYCSFSQLCFCDANLPEGAYFIVTEGFAQMPNFEAALQELRQLFC